MADKMRYLGSLLFGLLLASCAVEKGSQLKAERYLCTANSVVWTTTFEDGEKITGYNYEGADGNYVFSNKDGQWQAMGTGQSAWHFDDCNPSGLVCEAHGSTYPASEVAFQGAISRNPENGAFYATGVREEHSSSHVFAVAGSCSQYLLAF